MSRQFRPDPNGVGGSIPKITKTDFSEDEIKLFLKRVQPAIHGDTILKVKAEIAELDKAVKKQ